MNRTATAHLCLMASAFLLLGACSSSRAPAGGSSPTVFGDELTLTGSSIGNKDGLTEITLGWKTLRKPVADYYVFVHALDRSGAIAFQSDHPLKNATGAQTSAWTAGESLDDRFLVTPPANRPPGAYTLRIGVWDPKTGSFLKVLKTNLPEPADGWKGRAVLIENVECK